MDPNSMMRNMMQSMGMGMPFGGVLDVFPGGQNLTGAPRRPHHLPNDPFSSILPHAFMSPMSMMMMDPFQNMQQAMSMAAHGNGNNFSYCSSSVTSYTTDEHGRPQVYQQSNEVKQGPNGLKETKSALRDSRSGRQELAIGHHLHDKARIKKKSRNVYTGEEEQVEDLVNLEENEAETFEQTWRRQARNISSDSYEPIQYDQNGRPRSTRLALTSGLEDENPRTSYAPQASNQLDRSAMKTKKKKKSKEEKHK